MTSASFDRIWNAPRFSAGPPEPAQLQGPCAYAIQFQAWVDALFEKRLEQADRPTLNTLRLQVQDRYFLWLGRAGAAHCGPSGANQDHRCLAAVFEDAVDGLKQLELALDPPPLLEAVAPAPEPRDRLDGILIGELDVESEIG